MIPHLLLAAALLGAPPAAASTADLKSQVRELVSQLSADALQQRDAAEIALLALGPRVLDVLPLPNDQMTGEQRLRLTRIRRSLERTRAKSTGDGSRVTLSGEDLPLADALKQLQQQSGNRILDQRPAAAQAASRHTAIKFTDLEFWRALDLLLDQQQLTVDSFAVDAQGKPLRAVAIVAPLAPRVARQKHAVYSGAFRFEPLTIIARRGLADPAEDGLDLLIEAQWEPRLTPISLSFNRDTVQAVLDNGAALKIARGGGETMGVHGGSVRFLVPLNLPPQDARSIKRITGTLKALMPGHVETFRFPLKADAKLEDVKGGVTVRVDSVRRTPGKADGWEIGLRVKFDETGGALQSHLLNWVENNEVWLERPDGTRIDFKSHEPTREEESQYGASYAFPLAEDIQGCTLVYTTPAAVGEREIPIEMSEIQLP